MLEARRPADKGDDPTVVDRITVVANFKTDSREERKKNFETACDVLK